MIVLINNRAYELKSNMDIRNILFQNLSIDNVKMGDDFWVKAPKTSIPREELCEKLGETYARNPIGTHWVLLRDVDYATWVLDKKLNRLSDKVVKCFGIQRFFSEVLL